MSNNPHFPMQVRRFAAMGALVASAFALQVAFADRYVVAPMMEVVDCFQARTSPATQVSARPHFEEEIIVTAPRRGAGNRGPSGAGGHASGAVGTGAQPMVRNCRKSAAVQAAL